MKQSKSSTGSSSTSATKFKSVAKVVPEASFSPATYTLTLRPLGDRILVESVNDRSAKNTDSKSGLIIPDIAKEIPLESIVLAVGTGRTRPDGEKVPFDVKPGDHILASRYGGVPVTLAGKNMRILGADDVIAVLG